MGKKRQVSVTISARDRASKVFQRIERQGIAPFEKTLGRLRTGLLGVAAGFASIQQARASIQAFAEQEQAERRLADALSLIGANSTAALNDMKEFAAGIQRITVIGDEAVLQIAALGASLGNLSGDELKDATKAAIGLSRKLGVDTTAAMRLVARAAVGDTAALKRYGIVLEETLSPQEKFNQVLRIGGDAFSLATGEADTASGKMQQFKNAVGDLSEKFGEALMPALQAFTALVNGSFPLIERGFEVLGTAIDAFAKATVISFATTQFAFERWRDILKLTLTAGELAIRTFTEDVRHTFTTVIPTVLEYLRDNWKQIFLDIANFTKTALSNLVSNLTGTITSLPDLIRGEMSFDDLWKPLTDGFESALGQFPEIAGRVISSRERELALEISKLGNLLGNSLQLSIAQKLFDAGLLDIDLPGASPVPQGEGSGGRQQRRRGADIFDLLSRLIDRLTRSSDAGNAEEQRPEYGVVRGVPAIEGRFLPRRFALSRIGDPNSNNNTGGGSGTNPQEKTLLAILEVIKVILREIKLPPGSPIGLLKDLG